MSKALKSYTVLFAVSGQDAFESAENVSASSKHEALAKAIPPVWVLRGGKEGIGSEFGFWARKYAILNK